MLVKAFEVKSIKVSDLKNAREQYDFLTSTYGVTVDDETLYEVPIKVELTGRAMGDVIVEASHYMSSNQSDARKVDGEMLKDFITRYASGEYAAQESVTLHFHSLGSNMSYKQKVAYLTEQCGLDLDGTIEGRDGVAEAKALLEAVRAMKKDEFEALFA